MPKKNRAPSLKSFLKKPAAPGSPDADKALKARLHPLQLQMLRIQQGVWQSGKRVVIVFEGFDAAGKGGAIRTLTQPLDPRGVRVHAIGAPTKDELGRHYLQRFWERLPEPGTIAIFDRSWYGRLLVERVEKLTPSARIKEAYSEIVEFERMLVNDGIDVVKIFVAIHPEVQLERFRARLRDSFKQWKITEADVRARRHWDDYVDATEKMLARTCTRDAPWHVVGGDDKLRARVAVLTILTQHLNRHRLWLEKKARHQGVRTLKRELERLERRRNSRGSDKSSRS